MIDPHTGALLLDAGQRVEPTASLALFLASPVGRSATELAGPATEWPSYELRAVEPGGATWHMHLTFHGQRLHSARLSIVDDDSKGWDDWSEDDELAKEAAYAVTLVRFLGPEPHRFPWGVAGAVFDRRAGFAYVAVTYA